MSFHLETRLDDNHVVFVPVNEKGETWWNFRADSLAQGQANVESLNSAAKSYEE